MKVLFLNPHISAEHAVAKGLQAKGLAVLVAADAKEAWQMLSLHGANLDLVVVHREDEAGKDNEGGFKFLSRVKAAKQYADIPVIVTSHRWGDSQFAKHQDTAEGANAYLKWPFDAAAIYKLMEAVFGGVIQSGDAGPAPGGTRVDMTASKGPAKGVAGKSPMPPKAQPPKPQPKPAPSGGSGELVLEDASSLFSRNDRQERSDTSIRLEMPEPDASEPAAPPAPPTPAVTEAPSSLAIELGTSGDGKPSSGATPDIPVAENSGLSLHALPTKGPSGAGGKEVSIDEILDAPADGGLAIQADDSGADASDGMTTVGLPGALGAGAGDGKTTVGAFDGHTTVMGAPAPREPRGRSTRFEPEVAAEPEVSDSDAAQDMPYLFQGGGAQPQGRPQGRPSVAFALPLGDAVVPGGAAHAPDVETLKKYLLLREQDVAVLSSQLKAAKDQVKAVEEQLRIERGRCSELGHITGEQKRKLDEFEKEKQQAIDTLQSELTEMRFQLKAKTDKARVLDTQVREAAEEMERLKERVRADIRKIRVREKELENRLEIMKKDSEALISARENKIIELKRKLDLLEFNMDLLQDQHAREKESSVKLRERLAKAAQVVRVAGGLLDNPAGVSQLAAALAGDDARADDPQGEDAA